ncbi:MAG: Uma2 family endonuclease [Methylococcales bacterium]
MQPVELIPIHFEDYLQGELESKIRHEFYDGQVYAMACTGEKHNIISLNIASALRQKARGTECRAFIADMKLYIPDLNRFYYPDILLACDPADNHEYYKQNPCLIIEVLSPTTESIDRREKLHAYQAIPSVKEYLLVSQETMQVELYRRDGKYWQYILLNDPTDILQLSCLDLETTMPEIYEEVL